MQCDRTNVKSMMNQLDSYKIGFLEEHQFSLKNEEFDFQALVETSNVMILIFQDKNLCYVNSMVEIATGYSKAELFDNLDLWHELELTCDQEISLLTKDGDRRWLDCSVKETQFDQKAATLVTAVDITKYRQTKTQVEETNEPELNLTQSNSELNSMISHELRTPLSIIAFSHNLLQRNCDRWNEQKRKDCHDRISRAIETINLLVDEVAILNKGEAQQLRFAPQPIKVSQFCQTLLTDLQLANGRGRLINFSDLLNSDRITLDRNILQLILTNLLENAIKYSPQGQVVDLIVDTNDEQIIFRIEDRGMGIPLEDRQKLFEPFYRGSNVGELPGTGLGLAVVKKLVETHGGVIELDSQVEVGTKVIVSLPKK